jgi:hypothetical protein
MSQTSGQGLESGVEMREYTIARRPIGNRGAGDTRETSPLVHTYDGRESSPNSSVNPKYDEEPHSHYYDTSGTCQKSNDNQEWKLLEISLWL